MNNIRHPILRTLHIPYPLQQFIKIEKISTNIDFSDVLIKYLRLGMDKEINDIRDFPNNFYSSTVIVPAEIHDIIVDKARSGNISYNNIFNEYLILGVMSTDVKDRFQQNWLEELNKFLPNLKSIYDINILESKLKNLIDEKSELEENLVDISKQIDTMSSLIAKQKIKQNKK